MRTIKSIKAALNKRLFSQSEIARAAGVSQSTISRLDNTSAREFSLTVQPPTLRKLAAGLKLLSSGRRPAHKPVQACAGRSHTRVSPRKGSSK